MTKSEKQTILTEIDNKLFHITLNRPDKLNALSPQLLAELKEALDEAAENTDIASRAICIHTSVAKSPSLNDLAASAVRGPV